MVRLKIRQDFERNRHVQNLGVINMLLHKNQQEYQETMNQWKQEVSEATRTPGDPVHGLSREWQSWTCAASGSCQNHVELR